MSAETACQITSGALANSTTGGAVFHGVSVDTRSLRAGNTFFCLRGLKTDGHEYAEKAVAAKAGAIIVEKSRGSAWRHWTVPVIGVDDPLTALGDLAAWYRRQLATRFVAVTGSVGKTTTKEMIAAVLAAKYRGVKSPGNYNNLIGIPLTLLSLPPRTKAAVGVLEFGMSTPGEIRRLAEIIQPSWGVVTRIGAAHLEQMKSLEAVAAAKRELFDYGDGDIVAFLNTDDAYQRSWITHWRRPTVTYALKRQADFTADRIETTPQGTRFRVNGRHRFDLPLAGEYNVPNALAAIAVGRHLGVAFPAMAAQLRKMRPAGDRSRIVRTGGITIIADCYNANPTSMEAALTSLRRWPGASRRVAVLGAMRELGEDEKQWHKRIGALTRKLDLLVTVGDDARAYASERPSSDGMWVHCRDKDAAIVALRRLLIRGDVVLLKASHAEAFEEIIVGLRTKRAVRST